MAGAFHGVSEADAIINVGVVGPGVVKKCYMPMPKEKILESYVKLSRKLRLKLLA